MSYLLSRQFDKQAYRYLQREALETFSRIADAKCLPRCASDAKAAALQIRQYVMPLFKDDPDTLEYVSDVVNTLEDPAYLLYGFGLSNSDMTSQNAI